MTESGPDDTTQPDVERQRAELAETVEELTHRVDVSARTKAAVHEKTEEAVQLAQRRGPVLGAVAGAAVALLLVRAVVRRRRRR
ncbi:DUF3618 domain-containing protein [Rhodococcus sp. SGAir0479]|uniref:DUF3618 domain-containing protein n=1 Tax=Rhodococcus sp. SGAir0479 TaxID=2567884 RepID=UPI0010CD4D80|nr:DUF3618 domain-containing protein [Rhodococcus sp. SGAir0479]QCQ93289.1 DUF3618 domain-containing protein [Rhodococcus sp. SGAir0479]